MSQQIVVSVHDVTPAHESALRRIFDLLDDWQIDRTSMLVVPNFHRAWDLRAYPSFVDWLHSLAHYGHEIVLHGFEHSDMEPNKGRLHRRLIRRFYSREGEFYTLDYTTASERIGKGLALFSEIGFSPSGFVAPAWLQNPDVIRAAKDAGLRYVTSLWGFYDFDKKGARRAPVICYSPRKTRTAVVSVLYCDMLSPFIENCDLIRIAIHPGDIQHRCIMHSMAKAVRHHAAMRQITSYVGLL